MIQVSLWKGDSLQRLKDIPSESVDAVITDPPYGISFLSKEWDTVANFEAFSKAWLKEASRILIPGGYVYAFAATRTWHRLAIAMHTQGFQELSCEAWCYTSGFPKFQDVSNRMAKKTDSEDIVQLFKDFKGGLKPAWEPIVRGRKPL